MYSNYNTRSFISGRYIAYNEIYISYIHTSCALPTLIICDVNVVNEVKRHVISGVIAGIKSGLNGRQIDRIYRYKYQNRATVNAIIYDNDSKYLKIKGRLKVG